MVMSNITKRTTVNNLEEILHEEYPVLDHGFIRVIDYMGDDSSIVQAARVSYGKGTKHSRQDQGLINYLMRNQHSTPFEMCELKLHIKLPIFVARQWVRHRTANINEYSARYSILDKEFYIPDASNISEQSQVNNQGRKDEPLSLEEAKQIQELFSTSATKCYEDYDKLIHSHNIARELARMTLSTNFYTQWYWKIDLHNLFHFLKLRNDKHAQYEIREYAAKILEIVKLWVPMAYNAFVEHTMSSFKLSKSAIAAINQALSTQTTIDHKEYGISAREWDEIKQVFSVDH